MADNEAEIGMGGATRVLLVEDDPMHATVIRAAITAASQEPVDFRVTGSIAELLELDAPHRYDIVFTELGLPDSSGRQTFREVREVVAPSPIVVITGRDDGELARECLRAGAQDYLVKGRDEPFIGHALRGAIARSRLTRQVAETQRSLENVLEGAADAIVVLTPEGRILHANAAARGLSRHLRRGEICQHIPTSLHPGEMSEITVAVEGANRVMETRATAADWEGRAARVVVLRDITEQRRLEERTRRALAHSRALAQANEAMLTGASFQQAAERVLALCAELMDAPAGLVALGRDQDTPRVFALRAGGGEVPRTEMPTLPRSPFIESVLATGQPACSHDLPAGTLPFPGCETGEALRSAMAVPIQVDGAVEGLVLLAHRAHEHTADEITRAASFARILAQGLKEHRVSEALRRSHAKYKGIVENLGIGVSLVDRELHVLEANRQVRASCAGVDTSHKPKCYAVFNDPPRRGPCPRCPTSRTLADGKVHETTTEKPVGGQLRSFRVVSSPITDRQGEVVAAIKMVEDITEKAAAERRTHLLATLLSQTHDAVVSTDMEGLITSWNRGAERLTGYEEAWALGRSIRVALAEQGDPALLYATESVLAEREQYEADVRLRKRSGEVFDGHLSVSLVKDEHGAPIGTVILAQDVSARKRWERELSDSEHKFRSIFHGVADGILLADVRTKRFTMANHAICAMLGYDERELLEIGVPDIDPESGLAEVVEGFDKQVRGEMTRVADIPLLRKDGSIFYADVDSTPITLGGRELLMGCFRDVTERRKLEASLAHSDRLANMGVLAAGVGHEINNPLGYVLYNLECLARELEPLPSIATLMRERLAGKLNGDGEWLSSAPLLDHTLLTELATWAAEALSGTRRIRDVTGGLATFSRVDTEKITPVEPLHALQSALRMAANQIRFRATLATDLQHVPAVMGNDVKLSQVFLNLLVNAAQSIDEGNPEANEVRVRLWSAEGHVHVEVRDSGAGIPPEHMADLFEPFFTTKAVGEGSGLGLSICRNTVERYGGTITVESSVGEGCSFMVRLPIATTEQLVAACKGGASMVTARRPSALRGRVLLVDDDALFRKAATRMLRGDHEVETAGCGSEAIGVIEADPSFDLIVSDLMMPDGTGMDLHAWLSEQMPDLARRVVFLTGGVFTPKARDYLRRTQTACFEKPIDPADFRGRVAELVAENRAQGAST